MKLLLTILACLIVLTSTQKASPAVRGGNNNNKGNTRRVSDIIDIDDANDGSMLAGSGGGNIDEDTEAGEDDDDDDDWVSGDGEISSGDDLDEIPSVTTPRPPARSPGRSPPSTTVVLTLCQDQRRQRMLQQGGGGGRRPMLGAFMPRCTADGRFDAVQCHSSTGECWCVDAAEGREITGTRRRAPVDCSEAAIAAALATTSRFVPSSTASTRLATSRPLTHKQTTPVPQRSTTTRQLSTSFARSTTTEIDNKIENIPNEPDISRESERDHDDNYIERPVLVSEPKSRKMSFRASVIGQPGILAAIIGAAVIVLLCLVLLVMFIVYRMHRKNMDPAIYYIDKSSRAPLTGTPGSGLGSTKKAGYMKAMDSDRSDVYG